MNKGNALLIACITVIMMIQSPLQSVMPAYSVPEKNVLSEHQAHTISAVEGQTFTINLDSQTSTGYTWYITEPIMEDHIQLLGKTVMPYRSPGSRGKTIFTFQAVKAGRATITFEYARPWSWDVAQRCAYTIIIREKNVHCQRPKQLFPPFMLPWR